MRQPFIFSCLLLLLTFSAHAETLRLNSPPGSVVRYRLEKTIVRDNETLTHLTWVATFDVLEASSDGYRIAVTMDSVTGDDGDLPKGVDPELVPLLLDARQGVRIIYKADVAGLPASVDNLGDVRAGMARNLRAIAAGVPKAEGPPPAWMGLDADTIETITPDFAEKWGLFFLLDEVRDLFRLAGLDLEAGRDTAYRDEASPLPLGRRAIMTNHASIDTSDTNTLTVRATGEEQAADREAFVKMTRNMAAPDTPADILDNFDEMRRQAKLTTTAECRFRRADGWPVSLTSEFVVTRPEFVQRHRLTATRLQ